MSRLSFAYSDIQNFANSLTLINFAASDIFGFESTEGNSESQSS